MKKNIILGYLLFFPFLMFSQIQDSIKVQKPDSVKVERSKNTTQTKDIPFAIIEQAPIFPGCEKLDEHLRKMCLQNQIKWHVAKKFNTGMANKLGLSAGKKKVYVVFKIDTNGNVVDVRARGPHKALEKEGIRVVKLLPQMIPGKSEGKNVGVKYTLPITMLIEKPRKKRNKKNK